jgi:nucleoside-diphosphate-sugar epimerase
MTSFSKCIVLGAKGFIGSAIVACAQRLGLEVVAVVPGNYDALCGARADVLINAAGNSRKYLDAKEPVTGFDLSVSTVMRILHDFQYDYFVHLSSGAVYPREDHPEFNAETTPLDPAVMTNYGFHKWMAEQLVRKYAAKHLILRMGGFVGPGLKKNAVYDLMAGQPLHVHPDSEFQFMDTRDLARAVFNLLPKLSADRSLYNISAHGTISLREVAALIGCQLPSSENLPLIRAELNIQKVSALLDLPDSKSAVANYIQEFGRESAQE